MALNSLLCADVPLSNYSHTLLYTFALTQIINIVNVNKMAQLKTRRLLQQHILECVVHQQGRYIEHLM